MDGCGKAIKSERRGDQRGRARRVMCSKLIVGDPLLQKQLELDQNESETLDHLVLQMEKERGMDRAAAIADMRFAFIRKVCDASVIRPRESKERIRSE